MQGLEDIIGKRPTKPRFGFIRHRQRVEYLVSIWTWEEEARKHETARAERWKAQALGALKDSPDVAFIDPDYIDRIDRGDIEDPWEAYRILRDKVPELDPEVREVFVGLKPVSTLGSLQRIELKAFREAVRRLECK